jgi:hypothetical protein
MRGAAPAGKRLAYEPALFAAAQVRFADPKAGVDALQTVNVLTPVADAAVPVDWNLATDSVFAPGDLDRQPDGDAAFGSLAPAAHKPKSYDTWQRSFASWVASNRKLTVLRSDTLGMVSSPGETEGAFRVRLQQAARERRDGSVADLREQYGRRFAQLQDRLRRAQDARQREETQASTQKVQTAISFGATLLGAVFGRKTVSASTLGRATTAARGVSRTMKESADVKRAAESVEGVQQQIAALEAELAEQVAAIEASMTSSPLQSLTIAPKRTGITVQLVALVWVPYWI